MTELETMQRAKMYIDKLARGIDPLTDTEIPEDSALNQVRISRCLYYVSDILGRVIENDGHVGPKPKQILREFSITPEILARVPISQEPIRVTQLVQIIADTINDTGMRKLKTTVITDWLMDTGFLVKQDLPEGKTIRVPTPNGNRIGIFLQSRQGQYGEYNAVFYSAEAQKFILDNLLSLLPH